MSRTSDRELKPRNGFTLKVGLGARISGCANQKEMSLEDQTDHNKELAEELYQGKIDYLIIATKGKGERLDRPELFQIETEFRKCELDVFFWEDLGRLVRGVEAVRLLGIAVDHGTRVIVPNDKLDTANETWEADAIKACADHVAHQIHTSRRLKHKLRNRFIKHGGAMARPIAGYIVPDDAKSYDDWQKEPGAEHWILKGKELLRETLNGSIVADYFESLKIPVGPYCRRKSWDGTMVLRFYRNTLLKGLARRGEKHSQKHHESGRRHSVKNPKGPVYYACPHLAYIDELEYDELMAALGEKNAHFKRKPVNGVDPRYRIPRKRTRFPGQFGCCWYCGRQHVWGGNGIANSLMCSGSRQWECWNSIGYDGQLAVSRLAAFITRELYQLDRFDDQYRELVNAALSGDRSDVVSRRDRLAADERVLAQKSANLQNAIAEYGPKPMLQEKLQEIETLERKLKAESRSLERIGQNCLQVPESLMGLRTMFEEEFCRAAHDTPEFGTLLRKIVVDFRVHLVRLCDGGHLLPRARVWIALDGIVADAVNIPGVSQLLSRETTFDLFTTPQRERIREESVRLANQGFGPKAISEQIAERPTATAVRNALALDRLMKQLGKTDPYVFLVEPPSDYAKLRKHKNPKYGFAPLDGYTPPAL